MHHRLNKTLWAGLIVVALLVAGCGVSAQGMSTARTSASSPTAKPTLTWQKRALPPNAVGWAISPVTGRDGWACVPQPSGSFTILATHDAAAMWAQVGSVTLATPEPAGLCDLVADQGVSTALAAVISWGSGEAGTLRSIGLISTDSGAHWRKLAGEIEVGEMETVAGTTYAIINNTNSIGSEDINSLVISTDALRTWHTTRPAHLDTNDSFFDFHLGSSAGEIVAATYQNTLWQSADNGVSWSRIATPDQQTTLSAWLPQARQWMLCGSDATSAAPTCSVDTGKTWQQYPALVAKTPCGPCLKGATPTQSCYADAISSDGSLLAFCADGAVYRLAPQTNTWSALGTAPAPLSLLAARQLWCFNSTQGAFFVATLPF